MTNNIYRIIPLIRLSSLAERTALEGPPSDAVADRVLDTLQKIAISTQIWRIYVSCRKCLEMYAVSYYLPDFFRSFSEPHQTHLL